MKPSNKTMKPNKREVALGQMTKFKEVKLPETIKVEESHLYHVALITSTPNPKLMTWTHKMKVQMFNPESWNAINKNLAQVGHGQAFIFHNPVVMKEEIEAAEQLEAMEKRAAKKAKAEKEAATKKAAEEKAVKEQAAKDKKPKEPTFKELKEEAKALGMEMTNTTKKVDVVAFLDAKAKEAKEEAEKAEDSPTEGEG